MRRAFVCLFAALSALSALADTTVVGTFCSGNRALVSWIRYDINGAQIGQSGPVSWTSGTYTEALQPGTDGSRYFVTVVCPSGGDGTSGYWLVPDTESTLTVAKVAVSPAVKITDGWYWDTVSETWKNVAAGISGGGGGGAVNSVFGRTGTVTAQTGDYTAAQVTNAESTANKNAASGYAGLDAGSRIAKAQGHSATVYTDQANTYGAFKQDMGAAVVEIPNGTTLPATCGVGDQFMDTDASSGSRYYLCEITNTWVAQTGASAGSFPITTGSTQTVSAAATTLTTSAATNFVTVSGGNATIINTPSMTAGSDRQRVTQCNINAPASPFTLTLQDESVLPGSGIGAGGNNQTIDIEWNECHEFVYNAARGLWFHISKNVFYQPGPPAGNSFATVQSDLGGNNAVWTQEITWPSTTAQAITADTDVITPTRTTWDVAPDATRTLTSAATIPDGNDGEQLRIRNVHTTFSLTLQDEANLASSNLRLGGSNVTIGPRGSLSLQFSAAVGAWIRTDVPGGAAFTQNEFHTIDQATGVVPTAQVISSTANLIRYARYQSLFTLTFDTVSAHVSTAAAATSAYAAIYDSGRNLLAQSAAIDTTTTGLKTVALGSTVTIPAGAVFYVATACDSTTPAFIGYVNSAFSAAVQNSGPVEKYGIAGNSLAAGVMPATLGSATAGSNAIFFLTFFTN